MSSSAVLQLPSFFDDYIDKKTAKNSAGGRPHFVRLLAREKDPREEVLNILEAGWLKNKSIGSLARKYETTYQTVWRLLQDLQPWKQQLITFLEQVPRRKVFYNRDADSSDYESIQIYIKTSKRDGVKSYKRNILLATKCWQFLKYKDPANWTAEDVQTFLAAQKEGSQSGFLDCIRRVAPQIADRTSQNYLRTSRYREKLRLRKKDLFGPELESIIKALRHYGLTFHEMIFKLHITTGAREGSSDSRSGLVGLSWDRLKRNFTVLDLYESKVRGGIWWRDCPLNIFFTDLPGELKNLWTTRNRPTSEKLLRNGYHELLEIYRDIREALNEYHKDEDPSLFKELTTLKPHDADKIHVNLLWEAGVPLEVVAGKYLGRGEGIGIFGRGWLDINTLKKHYLSLTERSERIQRLRKQVQAYSLRFNERSIASEQYSHETRYVILNPTKKARS
jgi:hypothetical protein